MRQDAIPTRRFSVSEIVNAKCLGVKQDTEPRSLLLVYEQYNFRYRDFPEQGWIGKYWATRY